MTTLGIVGGGVLGRACARGFIEHVQDVKIFDVQPERSTVYHLADAATCDIVFIALPTPANPDGTCNTLYIEDFLRTAQLEEYWRPESCYVIRSTVPVGFTLRESEKREHRLPLLHSPEFLTARCALTDFQIPARNIIGYPTSIVWNSRTPLESAYDALYDLYEQRFPGVPLLPMASSESELVKLACNAFFASKVTLFNVFAEVAKASQLDWQNVRDGILSDGRIAHAHTAVPGPSGGSGFGGACLPKDTADLYHCARAAGVDAEILKAVLCRNERTRADDPGLTRVKLPD